MAAGNFRIVQLDGISRVAAQVQSAFLGVQFEADALITTLDDEERCHAEILAGFKTNYAAARPRSAATTLRF